MAETFDPYYKWLGIPPRDQPPHHYRLLGIELFEEDRDVIDAAANRVMSYLKDMAPGDDAAHSQTLLNEISRARICLLNTEKKAEYDDQLRQRLKAAGLLDTKPKKPAAKKPPPKTPKPTGPPPAKPPASSPPLPAITPPPQTSVDRFPAFEPLPPKAKTGEALKIVVSSEDAVKRPAAKRKESKPAVQNDQGPRNRPHRLLGVLVGLLVISVIAFIVSLIVFGDGGDSEFGQDPQSGGADEPGFSLPAFDPNFQSTAVDGLTGGYGRMVGHWKFDDDVRDSSGGDHHATLAGNLAFVDGKMERALNLSEVQRLSVPGPLFAESSEFSLTLWIKLDKVPDTTRPIVDGGTLDIHLHGGHPKLRVGRLEPAAGQSTDEDTKAFTGIDITEHLNQWVHLGLVYSAPSHQVNYYLNGEHRGFQRYAQSTPAEMSRLRISNFAGDIDDLRVFDYRLSSVAVKAIFDDDFSPLLAAPDESNGKVACETWHDVSDGLTRGQIDRITAGPPAETTTLRSGLWDMLPLAEGHCLNRIRGFLYPPDDGEYVFLLRSSGLATFSLQRFGADEDSLAQIILNDAMRAQSMPIPLESGKAYYFEVLHQYDGQKRGFRQISLGCRSATDRRRRPFAPPDAKDRQFAIPADFLASYGDVE
ncbi:MAG: hypothetical protein H8E44_28705 [Planctomycetes bacterium]|nr:hypothetical protein [Planctomycetota bacterium]MBL7038552.1 hypothetical protein [Pirellulaceae bacterium]